MHPVSYFLVSSVFFYFHVSSLFNLTCAIRYMFIYKSHILEIDAWLKMRKHLKMKRTSKILSYLLDHGKQMISAFAKFDSKNLYSLASLLCECFPFGTTLSVPFLFVLCPNVGFSWIPLILFLFHLHLCRRLFHISTPFMQNLIAIKYSVHNDLQKRRPTICNFWRVATFF